MRKKLSVLLIMVMAMVAASGLVFAEDVTITVWCWDPVFNIFAMEEAAKIYAETAPNVTIDVVETPWDDVQTKLTTAVMAGQMGTLPDILLMQDNATTKNITNFPGTFADLTDSGIDFSLFADYKVALGTVDGRVYAVPFDNGTAINAVRVDLLEEAGYTLADLTDITWSEYMEIGKDVIAKTNLPMMSTVAPSPDHIMLCLQPGFPEFITREALLPVRHKFPSAFL